MQGWVQGFLVSWLCVPLCADLVLSSIEALCQFSKIRSEKTTLLETDRYLNQAHGCWLSHCSA